jgi:hypothetical protein
MNFRKLHEDLEDYNYLFSPDFGGGFVADEHLRKLTKQFLDYTAYMVNERFRYRDQTSDPNACPIVAHLIDFELFQVKVKFNTLRIYYAIRLDLHRALREGCNFNILQQNFARLQGNIEGYLECIYTQANDYLDNNT